VTVIIGRRTHATLGTASTRTTATAAEALLVDQCIGKIGVRTVDTGIEGRHANPGPLVAERVQGIEPHQRHGLRELDREVCRETNRDDIGIRRQAQQVCEIEFADHHGNRGERAPLREVTRRRARQDPIATARNAPAARLHARSTRLATRRPRVATGRRRAGSRGCAVAGDGFDTMHDHHFEQAVALQSLDQGLVDTPARAQAVERFVRRCLAERNRRRP